MKRPHDSNGDSPPVRPRGRPLGYSPRLQGYIPEAERDR
eukprot:CAMPEP_0180407118 /NCGR_PEP_ID=MMETSP0989-20121125/41546_1 /TAXON_ID=697907 /ORGANISM="non described non described, Strain CCMP2293" /LENGTH=38 /DNA_ID= /DNA_START= /DNA_END= /DNA_ORIENTATION=